MLLDFVMYLHFVMYHYRQHQPMCRPFRLPFSLVLELKQYSSPVVNNDQQTTVDTFVLDEE